MGGPPRRSHSWNVCVYARASREVSADASREQPPIHRDMNADEKHREVERLVVERTPRPIIDCGYTDSGKRDVRDNDPGNDLDDNEDEQEPIENVVNPRSSACPRREPTGGRADPRPGQEEMDTQRKADRDSEPFV